MDNNSQKILYIDDDDSNRTLVRKLLTSAGYDFIEAIDGISGIDAATAEQPDLILMDMNMPGLDGYEATTRIKSLPDFEKVPIIAVTANALAGDKERSLIAGCEGYITKPIEIDTFLDDIESYLGGKKEHVKKEEQSDYLKAYSNKLVERLEDKIRSLTVALEKSEQANRMKQNFLAIMGHELRTPLHAIINMPEILKKKIANGNLDDQIELLDLIRDNGSELLDIVDNIMLYTQLESSSVKLSLSPMIIQDLIQSALPENSQAAEDKGLTIVNACSTELPIVNADIGHIKQVLSLLLNNAIKFTKEGKITFTCQIVNGDDEILPLDISNKLDTKDTFTMLCVNDTGIGIAEDKLVEIFVDFSQSEDALTRNHSGIGMGLAIARKLVELHHGHLWAKSILDQGSSFCFIIPSQSGS